MQNDKWQMTNDKWQMTNNKMTNDKMTNDKMTNDKMTNDKMTILTLLLELWVAINERKMFVWMKTLVSYVLNFFISRKESFDTCKAFPFLSNTFQLFSPRACTMKLITAITYGFS